MNEKGVQRGFFGCFCVILLRVIFEGFYVIFIITAPEDYVKSINFPPGRDFTCLLFLNGYTPKLSTDCHDIYWMSPKNCNHYCQQIH